MGKMIIAQRKGKGSPAYKSPSHRFFGAVHYPHYISGLDKPLRGQVTKFIDDPGHGPLLAEVILEGGNTFYNLAPEGLKLGADISIGGKASIGNVVPLSSLLEGTPVYNIELRPGDGGKLARTCGAVAYIATKDEDKNLVEIRLASRKVKTLSGKCLATVGVASGGGKKEKPFKKAGNKMAAMLAVGREWPKVRRSAMSAYNHPFGGRSFGKPTAVSRSTPPGRKVGHIAPRRLGRRRGMQ